MRKKLMNNFIIPLLVLVVFLFHLYVRRPIRWGKVKEGLCAVWCMDAVFAVCGTVISFALYHYDLIFFFTWQNILLGTAYIVLTLLFLLLSPSGIGLLFSGRQTNPEELMLAEYRFNDTLSMVRSFFMALLFFLPVFLNLPVKGQNMLTLLTSWEAGDVFGGFYFAIFLLLLPISLRQAFFWLKSLRVSPSEAEQALLQKYRMEQHYRRKNHTL